MPQRRIRSIMHGSAPGTRVYHHEHRSRRGRKKRGFGKDSAKASRDWKRKVERRIVREMDRDIIKLIKNK